MCCVYSPYTTDENEIEITALQRLGEIELEVDLPCRSVKNPLFLVVMSNYWKKYWIPRAGLWTGQIIEIAESAFDVSLYSNNQGLEGSFSYEKNHVSAHREDMSSIPEFIHRRWNDNVEAGRLLSRQLSTSHSQI